jgi:hypothetical protein
MVPDQETEDAVPRVAIPWIVGIVAFVAAAFGWVAVGVAQIPGWPWYAVVLFVICWAALGLVAMWGFVIQIFTRLDSTGVSQISLRGVTRIRWEDVSAVSEKQMGTLVLSDRRHSITIAPIAYSDAHAVNRWVNNRLRKAGAPAYSVQR